MKCHSAILAAIISLWACTANAATVRFGDAYLYGQSSIALYDLYYGGNLYIDMDFTQLDGSINIHAQPNSNLQYAITLVVAHNHDVAGADYFANREQYMAWTEYGDAGKSRTDYDAIILIDEDAYFAYHAHDRTCGDVYGWFQLGYIDNEVVLLNSAIDLDGDSIVVGAIPEPSSGLLLLLGVAGLSLRRRRTETNIEMGERRTTRHRPPETLKEKRGKV